MRKSLLVSFFALLLFVLVTPVASAQQGNFSANLKAVTTTAIPGETVQVTFEPINSEGQISFLPYWHPKGVSLFRTQPISAMNGSTIYLGSFFVDSALLPGEHSIEFQVVDEAGNVEQTSIMLTVGPGWPRDFDKIARRLAADKQNNLSANVAISHAYSEGQFQLLAHYKSAKGLPEIADIYRALLDANGWADASALPSDDPKDRYGRVYSYAGVLQAKKDGQNFILRLQYDALNFENDITVALEMP